MEIKGLHEAAENYQACLKSGLNTSIRLDRATGDVWATELVNMNHTLSCNDPAVCDITFDVVDLREQYWLQNEKPPKLEQLIEMVAIPLCKEYVA